MMLRLETCPNGGKCGNRQHEQGSGTYARCAKLASKRGGVTPDSVSRYAKVRPDTHYFGVNPKMGARFDHAGLTPAEVDLMYGSYPSTGPGGTPLLSPPEVPMFQVNGDRAEAAIQGTFESYRRDIVERNRRDGIRGEDMDRLERMSTVADGFRRLGSYDEWKDTPPDGKWDIGGSDHGDEYLAALRAIEQDEFVRIRTLVALDPVLQSRTDVMSVLSYRCPPEYTEKVWKARMGTLRDGLAAAKVLDRMPEHVPADHEKFRQVLTEAVEDAGAVLVADFHRI